MPFLADYYIDNNGSIYASSKSFSSGVASGQSYRNWIGVSNISELSGQSTLYVNYVHAEFKGTASSGGTGESYGWTITGVLPQDVIALSTPDTLASFQDLKGWPFKNSKKYYYAYTGDPGNSGNQIRTSYTWRPKRGRSLQINRQQAIYTAFHNNYGATMGSGVLLLTVQFRRGK